MLEYEYSDQIDNKTYNLDRIWGKILENDRKYHRLRPNLSFNFSYLLLTLEEDVHA